MPHIHLSEAFVVEAETPHRAGSEVVSHHVAVLDELEEHFFPRRLGHLQTETLLVASAEVREVGTFVPPLRPGLAIDERPGLAILEVLHAFDADDLRAEVRQKGGAPGQRMNLLQCQDPDALKQ
jgi:hypothetical protein